ncbi:MAG: electron transfer flavoprotein subunit alpha [Verrucomicrobia bacterium]|nr:electron transfer flavoprotein subunit alpha [Verrucomicrobiota bacterium]
METLLLLTHTDPDGTLGKPQLEALHAARQLAVGLGNAAWHVGLVGETTEVAARQIGACGAARFLEVQGTEFAQARYATDAAAAEALCRAVSATMVLAAGTARWSRVLPGVAQRLGGRADTHVSGLSVAGEAIQVTRWYYRQRMEARLQRAHRPWLLLLDPGAHPAWSGDPMPAKTENVPVRVTDAHQRTCVTGMRAPAADAQTIRPDADLLFVAGAGWTKKQADGQTHVQEAERLIGGFLSRTRASLGSSKSLVDLGGEGQAVLSFLTHLNQIGQTGATPRHPKGLSACCHGEEPHTVGWRFIDERRAIDLDPNCGWARGKADVLYVADAFAVMARLNELLQEPTST